MQPLFLARQPFLKIPTHYPFQGWGLDCRNATDDVDLSHLNWLEFCRTLVIWPPSMVGQGVDEYQIVVSNIRENRTLSNVLRPKSIARTGARPPNNASRVVWTLSIMKRSVILKFSSLRFARSRAYYMCRNHK